MTSPASLRRQGRIKVHTRGFGFLLLEPPPADLPASAFVTPPDLNAFLSEDLAEAEIRLAPDGRATAHNLTLVRRNRAEILGQVVSHGGGLHVRADKLVANTDWPLDPGGLTLKHGEMVVAKVEGKTAVAQRKLDASQDLALERVRVRHGVRTVVPQAALSDVARAREAGHRARAVCHPPRTTGAP